MTSVYTKKCRLCLKRRSLGRFYKNKANADGLFHECKDCHAQVSSSNYFARREHHLSRTKANNRRRYRLKRDEIRAKARAYEAKHKPRILAARRVQRMMSNYGMTVDDHKEMVKKHRNRCAVCKSKPDARWGKLCIDHCHRTGMVRGLLCFACNTSIGKMRDNVELIRKLADYVSRYQIIHAVILSQRGRKKSA